MRKAAEQDFDELHRRGQENLIRFLQLEIELGQTMGKISETTERQGHRARLLRNVRGNQNYPSIRRKDRRCFYPGEA
jgi:hypothetical protein